MSEDYDHKPWERLPRLGGYLHAQPPETLRAHEVIWEQLAHSDLARLRETLSTAADEWPIQELLTGKPHILVMGVLRIMRQAWVLPKPRFADRYVPDFLVGIIDSLGPGWMLVELESPNMTPINKNGSLSTGLHHAVQQIRDNRRWLAENALYFRQASECWGIEAGCAATVLIGRRADRQRTMGADRLRDLRSERVEVMSYDRLVENYQHQAASLLGQRRSIEELAELGRAETPRGQNSD